MEQIKFDGTLISELWIALNSDDPSEVERGLSCALKAWMGREIKKQRMIVNWNIEDTARHAAALADALEYISNSLEG